MKAPTTSLDTVTALEPLIDAAIEYAYPLFAVAATRFRAVHDNASPNRHAANTLRHERQLGDHTTRWITAPNNDTLYSNAWLDLSAGPVRLCVGAMPPGRYWSVALMDAFTNHIAVLGQREDGCGPVDVTLVGPEHRHVPVAGRTIDAPGNDVWLLARWLVDGPGDAANAHAMQDRLEVVPPAGATYAPRVVPREPIDAQNFLTVVNDALGRDPAPSRDHAKLMRLHGVGLRPGAANAWHDIGEPARRAWATRMPVAHERLGQAGTALRRDVQGWIAATGDIGSCGDNHALRASVALGGLGALPPVEAMYFVKYADDAGRPLDGRHRYALRVSAQGIPTDSFWSFSMYQPTSDGRRFFVHNPIDRWSIGNRTPGVVLNADGSIDIALQHDAPQDARRYANWLPAPAAGPFQIALRAYLPRPELRAGSATMPVITRT